MTFSAIVVAAGEGLRAGPGEPKAWRLLGSRPLVRWSVEALRSAGAREIVVVVAPDRLAAANEAFQGVEGWRAVAGGKTRAESVRAGLAAIAADDEEPVLVHDAARPFVTRSHVERLLGALQGADGAIPALPVPDTLKRGDGLVEATVSREGLWRAQTPQAVRLGRLRAAYGRWPGDEEPTDDAAVVERDGGRVALVPGDPMLMKLTWPEDFMMAEQLVGSQRIVRTGFGIDAHRFGPGDAVMLGGVRIAHDRGLVGHSDADAGLHALTDALLGAVAEGDIGQHFPPSDPKWRGASSDQFLVHAVKLAQAKGARILSADLTLVCERPKIGPHRDAIRARIAELLGLPIDRVSVKATTTEGMGFTGREEGLMAQAVVSVEAPP
ncbi:bifunctional 2-C-methyl-D-erythritol 4-phosphate cytidylyltransferase/2-C-methyl-D-erythritol 2,4-cyclodiphosphate synthase [Phenylobacterium sp.]|jgi:2-C-methyl-D-erythritol 4-phosphate cytidylyltransferase/2-C-methyl-D-erythritol 2,4-cyclodiphosphate synthase|uniref:bifunctional 2-C-methyl-D-erythritol 4-phosphate cytidylyltransferase/2-C-methyl-D-erythritol 2,4-cyclodiphosphate synthase n=1 Tax=Phenylobacterium sp. TaxID=1871053 RepID=UPI002E36B7C0|nr:bifunctional 2-C-methyl-D-erythritol 4-phosphate cytidylyltransferase/2-C-methyl-D-erythritol 2,4-cyclodiphosphate synthase [Phenylobacterium sp.]HEX4711683.1 bifunctional 2-C-methyl-D-erythritol 4-phosphate cytidylyltransferase/2-C-methyl-D-erythritol 2,4-cyclodiphosphate synthase [Phenylobacterium sp.]